MPAHIATINSAAAVNKAISQNMHELSKPGAKPRSHAQKIAISISEAKAGSKKKK